MIRLGNDELGLIFNKITDPNHRNSISLVCKQWLRIEGLTRLSVRVLEPNLIPRFLFRFPNLINFIVATPINNKEIQFVVQTCPNIEVLNLNLHKGYVDNDELEEGLGVSDVDDDGLCVISNGCKRLCKVLLRNRKGVGDKGVISLMGNLKNLACLDLSRCSNVKDEALKGIGGSGSIRVLNLRGCSLITDKGLDWLVSGLSSKSLEKLVVAECDRITDLGLLLLKQMQRLEELDLGDCGPRITDIGGLAIANIGTLKKLNLSWLINITDITIIEIAKNCRDLLELDVMGCEDITGDGICAFANHDSLESIVMVSCYNVLADDVKHLAFGCRSLKRVGVDRRLRPWMPVEMQKSVGRICLLDWI